MEMSVREARAQFAYALAAAEKGERVTITKNGKPVAELVPPSAPAKRRKLDWDELDRIQEELGIPKPAGEPERDFDDPSWTEELFGPEYR
jgi:prevent-host-death family protein